MNISETEVPIKIVAKTCGCREKNRRTVTYRFIDSYHSLCLDKKDLIFAELEACERLLKYAVDEGDRNTADIRNNGIKNGIGSFDLAYKRL